MYKLYFIKVQDGHFNVEMSDILKTDNKFIKINSGSVSKSSIDNIHRNHFDGRIIYQLYCTDLQKGIKLMSDKVSGRIAELRDICFNAENMLKQLKGVEYNND